MCKSIVLEHGRLGRSDARSVQSLIAPTTERRLSAPEPPPEEILGPASETFLVASFAREEHLLAAVRQLRQMGRPVAEVYTPYPIHDLDALLDVRPSRLGWVTFGAGLGGGLAALALQLWTSAVNWPINVGGKPRGSVLAFVPITFELTILAAGLATAAAFLWRSRLRPGARPRRPLPRVTDDRFAIVIAAQRAGGDRAALRELFESAGAESVEEPETGP